MTYLFVLLATLATAFYIFLSTHHLPWILPKLSSWLVEGSMGSHYGNWFLGSFIAMVILWVVAGLMRIAEKK